MWWSNRIYILFLCFFAFGSSYCCPRRCVCAGTEVSCSGQGLTELPEGLDKLNITRLSLDHNNITEIENDAFRGLEKLEVLSINRNHLEYIQEEAFSSLVSLSVLYLQGNRIYSIPIAIKKLKSLQELYLYHNQISRIPSGIFQSTRQLNFVELGHNPLRRIDPNAFANLPYLKKLALSEVREPMDFPNLNGSTSIRVIKIDRSKIKTIDPDLCSYVPELISLELRSNQLSGVPDLGQCHFLRVLDLSGNRIADVSNLHFKNQSDLQDLLLHNNHIHKIGANSFVGLDNLKTLDLSSNRISYIDPEAFIPFRNSLTDLNVGDNSFDILPTAGLENVEHLKAYNNPRLHMFPGPESLPRVRSLIASYAYHCCQYLNEVEDPGPLLAEDMEDFNASSFLGEVFDNYDHFRFNLSFYKVISEIIPDTTRIRRDVQCAPKPGPFMPCDDLFEWWGLRCSVWLVFLTALLGNGVVVFVLVFSRSKIDVPRFLVANLAAADFFMGLYLGILAFVDASTIGEFRYYAISWQYSGGCKLAGFFGVLSSELSVFTLAVITMERNYAITHAMHLNKRLSLRHASYIMTAGWSFAFAVALMPLFGISDYRKFAVCLPFEVGDGVSLGYVIFLMATNGTAVSILLACYLKMYCAIRGSHAWNSNDTRIAKRMALLVFTDFLCWAPVAFFSLTSAFGYHLIGLEEAKVLTVFILPVNSCINPFLYAILTKQFKKDCVLICKAIEESRVTRGIGRCRHSSNFSNQKTPANTNSTDRSRDGSSCQCSSRSDNFRDHRHKRPHQRLLRAFMRCYDVRDASDVSSSSQDYPYKAAPIQKKQKKKDHKRAESVSSDNFSSSRSDSVKQQGCVPLSFGRRRNSWTVTRKPSQDSSLSNSRNDSSTSGMTNSTSAGSNWRSRSSVSSDVGSSLKDKNYSKEINIVKDKTVSKERGRLDSESDIVKYGRVPRSELVKRSSVRQLPTSPLAAGTVQCVVSGKYPVQRTISPKDRCSGRTLPKPKPKLTRQIAFHDESSTSKSVSFDISTPIIKEPCPVHRGIPLTSDSEDDDVFEKPAYIADKDESSDNETKPTDKLLQYYTQAVDRNKLRVSTFQPRKLSTISSRSVSLNPENNEEGDDEQDQNKDKEENKS
ncbi:lutropin-choriogonadotropic hormone receptor-like isoform X2 [Artemia franciscana]|uniref:lutropin-choriogonadotropic hormone receptor-like isoform X2 n=1 Tax=Artemia franciscana TaxID=6661 RepID=UPI0032DAF5A7